MECGTWNAQGIPGAQRANWPMLCWDSGCIILCNRPPTPSNTLAEMEARWAPSSPEERSYYDKLFVLADASKVGRLAGQSAVGFLGKSSLPFPILKEVSTAFRYLSQSHLIHLFVHLRGSLPVNPFGHTEEFPSGMLAFNFVAKRIIDYSCVFSSK